MDACYTPTYPAGDGNMCFLPNDLSMTTPPPNSSTPMTSVGEWMSFSSQSLRFTLMIFTCILHFSHCLLQTCWTFQMQKVTNITIIKNLTFHIWFSLTAKIFLVISIIYHSNWQIHLVWQFSVREKREITPNILSGITMIKHTYANE